MWTLVARDLGLRTEDLIRRSTARRSDERPTAIRTAKQSLVVTLACFVGAGRLRRMVAVNELFDALARRWSPSFRQARQRSGARTILNMLPDTVKAARRDLLRNGIRFEVLWKIATGRRRLRRGRNPLDMVQYFRFPGFAGYQVLLKDESPKLVEFERLVGERFHSRIGRRLLLQSERTPRRPKRYVAGERQYNVVKIGPRAEAVRKLQQQARLRFNVCAFLEDYERAEGMVRSCEEIVAFPEWREKRNLLRYSPARQLLTSTGENGNTRRTWYPSPRDIETKRRIPDPEKRRAVRGLFRLYDDARHIVDGCGAVARQVRRLLASGAPLEYDRYLIVKSAYDLQISHRYQHQHFWPPSVSAQLDQTHEEECHFLVAVAAPGEEYGPPKLIIDRREISTSKRGRWFAFPAEVYVGDPYGDNRLIGMDISSSQTQILAVLVGIEELEAEAARRSFKKYLAGEAWRRHTDSPRILAGLAGDEAYLAYPAA